MSLKNKPATSEVRAMWGRIFFHSTTYLNFKSRQFAGKQLLGMTLGCG